MEFDVSQPSEFICSLYRVQAKYRNSGITDTKTVLQMLESESLERHILIAEDARPVLLSTFYETLLLLSPKSANAMRLLRIYSDRRYIQTFLTPQWTYRAALIILDRYSGNEEPISATLEAYGMALAILDRAALRWEGAASMSNSLISYIQDTATYK